jgi:chromosome segregation ATPase
VCFVPYERLLAEPEAVARELVNFCSSEPLSDEPERLAAVVDHLDAKHRHQQDLGHIELEPSQVELDEDELALAGVHEAYERGNLPLETANLQLAFDEVHRLSAYVEEVDRLNEKVGALEDELERQVTSLKADLADRSAEAGELAAQVTAIRAEADDYLRQLTELRDKLPLKAYAKAKGLLGR